MVDHDVFLLMGLLAFFKKDLGRKPCLKRVIVFLKGMLDGQCGHTIKGHFFFSWNWSYGARTSL